MSAISTFNNAISKAINTNSEDYRAIIGDRDFTPSPVILESSDFNCGALCNELEYLRSTASYYSKSFDLDVSENTNLDALITALIDLPRRNRGEADSVYRNRFRFLVNQKVNRRRTTRWSIADALREFIPNVDEVIQIVELFDTDPTYFQLRIEGVENTDQALFLNDPEDSYLNQGFLGGAGVGVVISYIGELVDRIRAAGVDYDLLFISQFRDTISGGAVIGTVQRYMISNATVMVIRNISKTSNATVSV